jgi:hypothetical protein
MADWWVPVISAGAALGGVLLADLRQRSRERQTRFAALRQEVFVDIYAWTLRVSDALPGYFGRAVDDVPVLTPELLARLYIYLDEGLARDARVAAQRLQDLSKPMEQKDRSAAILDVAKTMGAIQAQVQIRTKAIDTRPMTRLRWRVRRILHPPLSTDDPSWKQLPRSERLRRRLREARTTSSPRDPLQEEGIGPSP